MVSERDTSRLSRAYAKMRIDWPFALTEFEALADAGSVESMLYLASAYQRGTGPNVDPALAAKWWQRAKEKGSVIAAYYLGHQYLTSGEYSLAEQNFIFAASGGFAPAQTRLGIMYASGKHIHRDETKARELLEAAYSNGHIYGHRYLASLLIQGKFGWTQRLRGAVLWLTHILAMVKLAYREAKSKSRSDKPFRFLDVQYHY